MRFESRFNQPPSVSYQQNNSLISNSRNEATLDYFNDSRNQPNPGNARPPENQNPQKSKPSATRPTANWTFDDQQQHREAKREEWRKSLLEQVQEKDRKKQEEKNKRLLEDKKLEERLNYERLQLESKYKKEIQAELGLPYEEEPKNVRQAEPPRPVVKHKEKAKESPMPVMKEIEPTVYSKAKMKAVEFNPMKIEYWKSRSDLEIQQNSFKNILTKLKQDADQAHYERNEAMMELDRFREQLRMSNLDKDLHYQQKHIFQRNYSSSLPKNYKAMNDSENISTEYFSVNSSLKPGEGYYQVNKQTKYADEFGENKPLTYESKFVPLVSAGHSVISNSSLSKQSYTDLDLNDVKDQLVEIDQLLNSYE